MGEKAKDERKIRGLRSIICNRHAHTRALTHTQTLIAAWESTTYAAEWTNRAEDD